MNLLSIEHLSKSYSRRQLFDDTSFFLQEGEKVGIIGINGTGKSTLLKIMAGLEETDEGTVTKANHAVIAYLPQHPVFDPEMTALDCVLAGHRELSGPESGQAEERDHQDEAALVTKAKTMLTKLGVSNFDQKSGELSGGQRKRLALVSVLLKEADILLLDEPTNHLDHEMADWLEEQLKQRKEALVMITHDRYFLDSVCNRIAEVDKGKLYSYDTNYAGYLELKAQREEMAQATELKRQNILRTELAWVQRGARARSTKQKARLERLEGLKNGSAPVSDQTVELDSIETRMGKKTIELHHIAKAFGDRVILRDFDYIFLKNQNVGIVGPNGCGKSTLLRMIAGETEPDQGSIEVGETIRIGYFAQEEQEMDDRQRVIDYVKDIAEYINTREGRISASAMLERFLFTPDMQYAPIGKLSGGEKRRLYLLGVLCQEANVLILDEPGNNLDIPTLTILEDFLNSFVGIVITVSHDRYFLDNVADRIFAFDGHGGLTQYEGGYTDYLEASGGGHMANAVTSPQISKANPAQKEDAKKSWKQNRPKKLKFSYKEQKEFETIDDDIAKLEAKMEHLDEEMARNATNSVKLSELIVEKDQTEAELEEKMDRWVYLNDLKERIQNGE